MSDTGMSADAGAYSNRTTATDRPQGPAQTQDSNVSPNIGMATTLLGGITDAYGRIQTGKYNSRVARFNANYARVLAAQVQQAANEQIANRELKERYIEGGTRSGYAAQGVVVGAGTSRAVLESEAGSAARDKMLIEINARRQAYGYQVSASDQDARGSMATATATAGAISTGINTASQLLLEDDPAYGGVRSSRGFGN